MAEKKVTVQVTYHLLASLVSFGSGVVFSGGHVLFDLRNHLDRGFRHFRFLRIGFWKAIASVIPSDVIASLIFLVLLFIENARTSREYLGSYSLKHPVSPGAVAMSGIAGALISLLANPDASGK